MSASHLLIFTLLRESSQNNAASSGQPPFFADELPNFPDKSMIAMQIFAKPITHYLYQSAIWHFLRPASRFVSVLPLG
ncbi:hypothetical protein HF675_01335 [Serratia sp. JUb9]|uniref:hypothetical protein n=1 Tax=Serratia sp. JUb9 TaxID=2724469 RepID=UPI00164CE679|nr:hypothetical protein [Serratia sp. JUb9]QNK32742.1 hypothetical protein HF675_01335 [Serratia sp. JUb9]